jgi:hypothetical protein
MKIQYGHTTRQKLYVHLLIGFCLIAASAAIYFAQLLIFRRTDETLFYLMQDLAFLPISALLVTLILEGVLNVREKKSIRNKLYMVIGTFYTEMGSELIRMLSNYDRNLTAFRSVLHDNLDFTEKNLIRMNRYLKTHDFRIQSEQQDISALKDFLHAKRDAVMRLLENPNLLEHDHFTDLLWAVSHLSEELAYRDNLIHLSIPDRQHLEGDIARAYNLLTAQWLAYVRHLKENYPYIFSLVIRVNPFESNRSAELKIPPENL